MSKRAAIFLDRDGTINDDRPDYVKDLDEFRFLPGALDALAALARLDAEILVVTNQSAVGRGILSQEGLERIHQHMLATTNSTGGRISQIYVCPHTPWAGCGCRKPRPGLLERAAVDWKIDLGRSVMVGDRESDVRAGRFAGCKTILLSGQAPPAACGDGCGPNWVLPDLCKAVEAITAQITKGRGVVDRNVARSGLPSSSTPSCR